MLEFTANGRVLGDTIALDARGDVRVQASAEAAVALSRIEVVHNGVVVSVREVDSSARSARLDQPVRIRKTGWLGARVHGASGAKAHTSPICVQVSGERASCKEDATYSLEWIDVGRGTR